MGTMQITEAELLAQFREFMARKQQGPHTFVPLQNHPEHRGVHDPSYVRPAPREYPRMMYHASLSPKIVNSKKEQEALGPLWFTSPIEQKADWRSKANEVYTKSGYRVRTHHVAFLQQSGVPNIETMANAAEFLDKLNEAEQEAFFREAEEITIPAPQPEVKEEAAKGKKKAA